MKWIGLMWLRREFRREPIQPPFPETNCPRKNFSNENYRLASVKFV